MNGAFEIREYVENGRSPYAEWYEDLDSVTVERVDKSIIILLGGGSKRRQEADIAAAMERWKRYKQTRR